MSNPNATAAPAHRAGGRPQVHRSLSELSSPVSLRRGQHDDSQERHRHRRHLHQPHRRHRQHRSKERSDEELGAHRQRGSVEMPRQDGPPVLSPTQSRRQSIMQYKEEDVSKMDNRVREEREKALFRVEGLKQSLADLDTFSTTIRRRLDEMYYGIMEKVHNLQGTVAALKDLAETSRDLYGSFEVDSRGLENDIVTQLSSVGQFDEQEGRIDALQGQINGGRQRIQALGKRLDAVRERVEGWERADKAWRETTRKRLKALWKVMTLLLLVVLAIFLGVKYEAQVSQLDDLLGGLSGMTERVLGGPNVTCDGLSFGVEEDGGLDRRLVWKMPEGGDRDERLRAFDEL